MDRLIDSEQIIEINTCVNSLIALRNSFENYILELRTGRRIKLVIPAIFQVSMNLSGQNDVYAFMDRLIGEVAACLNNVAQGGLNVCSDGELYRTWRGEDVSMLEWCHETFEMVSELSAWRKNLQERMNCALEECDAICKKAECEKRERQEGVSMEIVRKAFLEAMKRRSVSEQRELEARKRREAEERKKLETERRRQMEESMKLQQELEAKKRREAEEHKKLEAERKRRLEESKKRKQELEKNRLHELSHTYKPDAGAFKAYLNDKHVKYFYHFTDRKNIESIKSHGGLFSWKYCDDHGIAIPNPGGDDTSRALDCRHNLADYVRLSFCDNHPMSYRMRQNGARMVLLKVKVDVAWLKDTMFSDMNATDNCHSHGEKLEDLKKVDIVATKSHFLNKCDPMFKKHQAEVMVKTFVPVEYIVNIDNPTSL